MDSVAVWDTARAKIRDELGWVRTHPWLDELRLRSIERGVACLIVGSAATRKAVYPHTETIQDALEETVGRAVHLRILLRKTRGRTRKGKRQQQPPQQEQLRLTPQSTSSRHQLTSFFGGRANDIPLRFARQAVNEPGQWHPLVFYGEPGSGKTHLLQGIVNGYRRQYPGRRAVYASSDRFARQFLQSLRHRQTDRFRELYRSVDLLVLDDLQSLAGKQTCERELNHTLDHYLHAHRQVVLACSEPPKRIPQLQAGLEGRLLGGQVVELRPPDPPTRLEIVRAGSAERGLRLGQGVVELLTTGFDLSVRELFAAMTRLAAHQRHTRRSLDLAATREILRDLLQGKLKPVTLAGVAEFVAERLDVDVKQLRGRSRKPTVVRARQVAMGLMRDLSPLTLREVGAYFGNKSPASVHFAQERARQLREEDPRIRELWEAAHRAFERTP